MKIVDEILGLVDEYAINYATVILESIKNGQFDVTHRNAAHAALETRLRELFSGEAVAYLHQVVMGDGEPDQALSFEPDNFPLAGVLGYRSLSHEPLFRAPQNNELEHLRAELGRAYRALHAFAFADRDGKRLNETAVMYHSPTIGAAARFVHEGALDGSEYFIGKTVDVLHAALRGEQPLPANT